MRVFVLAVCVILVFSSNGNAKLEEAVSLDLQVGKTLVYASTGSDVNLTCYINGTGLLSANASWRFKESWLDDRIQRSDTTLLLALQNVTSNADAGMYTCCIRNETNDALCQSATVVIGDLPPKVKEQDIVLIVPDPNSFLVKWQGYNKDVSISYDLLYCKSSKKSRYCLRPSLIGYTKACTGLQRKGEASLLECDISGIVRKEFPQLFNINISNPGASTALWFSVRTRNVFGEQYSTGAFQKINRNSLCGKPRNVNISMGRRNMIVNWDAPLNPDQKSCRFMMYKVTAIADRDNSTRFVVKLEVRETSGIQQILSSLSPGSVYRVYVSSAFDESRLKSDPHTVGPFEVSTLEDVPSSSPTVTHITVTARNLKTKNVTLHWTVPPRQDRNGKIRKFLIFVWRGIPSGNYSVITVLNKSSNESELVEEGELWNLDRFLDHFVRLSMCTSAGCSENGTQFKIVADNEKNDAEATTSSDGHSLIIGITVAGFALLIVVIIAAIIVWRARDSAHARRRGDLSDIGNPMPYDYQPASDVVVGDDAYDKLVADATPEPDGGDVPDSPVGERSTEPLISGRQTQSRTEPSLEMSTEL